MGIAHAIGRRMTIRVTRSQTKRTVPFIVVAILTSRSWVVSTPTPRLGSPLGDPGPILARVWSQSGFSPTVLHGLPHHASGKAAVLIGRILLDENPFWPDGAPNSNTPLPSCAASPEALVELHIRGAIQLVRLRLPHGGDASLGIWEMVSSSSAVAAAFGSGVV